MIGASRLIAMLYMKPRRSEACWFCMCPIANAKRLASLETLLARMQLQNVYRSFAQHVFLDLLRPARSTEYVWKRLRPSRTYLRGLRERPNLSGSGRRRLRRRYVLDGLSRFQTYSVLSGRQKASEKSVGNMSDVVRNV